MRDPHNSSKDKPHWPGWFYGPNGEAEIFQSPDEVPKGWYTTPQEAVANSAAKSAAITRATEPDFTVPQAIENIEAKKANNSADELSAFKRSPGRPRK